MPERHVVNRHQVSIHALLAECDSQPCMSEPTMTVSIHALLAECDGLNVSRNPTTWKFQSTHSLRSATSKHYPRHPYIFCFNPRTPCGVRRPCSNPTPGSAVFQSTHSLRSATRILSLKFAMITVSIHALLAECDIASPPYTKRAYRFQSTHSLRSATKYGDLLAIVDKVSIHALLAECDPADHPAFRVLYVSIHALLAECDRCRLRPKHPHRSFNPRTPCGVRPAAAVGNGWATVFQSTHSLRSATPCLLRFERDRNVSIHALLAECDGKLSGFAGIQPVSIHALLAECDVKSFNLQRDREVSIHALLAECDFFSEERMGRLTGFNPRTPCGVRLRPTLYIATQQSKSYFAPTSLKRPSLHGCSF